MCIAHKLELPFITNDLPVFCVYLGRCHSAGHLSTIGTHDSVVGSNHSHCPVQSVVLCQGS